MKNWALLAFAALWAALLIVAAYSMITGNTMVAFLAIVVGMPASFGLSMVARRFDGK